mmetsp:Transcript_14483/g.23576  ORF Transcript_14483/g.23576 Transcript_14483/m.23576 type:complete len:285 (-) Transcript_14483:3365-4219(-)
MIVLTTWRDWRSERDLFGQWCSERDLFAHWSHTKCKVTKPRGGDPTGQCLSTTSRQSIGDSPVPSSSAVCVGHTRQHPNVWTSAFPRLELDLCPGIPGRTSKPGQESAHTPYPPLKQTQATKCCGQSKRIKIVMSFCKVCQSVFARRMPCAGCVCLAQDSKWSIAFSVIFINSHRDVTKGSTITCVHRARFIGSFPYKFIETELTGDVPWVDVLVCKVWHVDGLITQTVCVPVDDYCCPSKLPVGGEWKPKPRNPSSCLVLLGVGAFRYAHTNFPGSHIGSCDC